MEAGREREREQGSEGRKGRKGGRQGLGTRSFETVHDGRVWG